MQTINIHGGLPANVRDHGVFSSPKTTIATQPITSTLEELTARKSELDAELTPLLEKLKEGTADKFDLENVSRLSPQVRDLAEQIQATNVERASEERKREADLNTSNRKRFEQVLVGAGNHRSEFERLFREACIHLGSYCAGIDEAQSLLNQIMPTIPVAAGVHVKSASPEDRDRILELTRPLSPLTQLLDSGYSATTSFGWNFSIAAMPLKPRNGVKQ